MQKGFMQSADAKMDEIENGYCAKDVEKTAAKTISYANPSRTAFQSIDSRPA